jgi:hypothetical protein
MTEELGYNADIWALPSTTKIPGIRNSQTVVLQFFCCVFQQNTYLPLRYAPLEIESELEDVGDPIISDGFALEGDTTAGVFKASNTSVLWKLKLVWLRLICVHLIML